MIKTNEPFRQERFEQIQKELEHAAAQDQRIEYAVIMDGVPVINRTVDPLDFKAWKEHINENSRTIQVLVFHDSSNECERHIFHLPLASSGRAEKAISSKSGKKKCKKHRKVFPIELVMAQSPKYDKRHLRIENRKLADELKSQARENELLRKIVMLYERQDTVLESLSQLPAVLSSLA